MNPSPRVVFFAPGVRSIWNPAAASNGYVRLITSHEYPVQFKDHIWSVNVDGKWTMLSRMDNVPFGTGCFAAVFVDHRSPGKLTLMVAVEIIDEGHELFSVMSDKACTEVFERFFAKKTGPVDQTFN